MRRLFAVLSSVVVVSISASACTSILGDFEVDPSVPTTEGGAPAPGTIGAACATATECNSGFCADGFCCESACSGTCETCAGANKGKCEPVPDGQDPKNQCLPAPRPDAGVIEPDAAPPLDDGGLTDAALLADAASQGDDAGLTFDPPDGGLVPSAETACKGVCNGAKACKFPDKKTSCGTQYCSSPTENSGLRCDGKGYCELQSTECAGYACSIATDGVCKTTCATDADCDSTKNYCDNGQCKPKLPNGTACSLPGQCSSGFCIIDAAGGVCCNSECDKIPGGNCKQTGSVGQCKCNVNCGAAACRLFYKDGDGDTHGDENAKVEVPGSTVVGCEGQVPPATFSNVKDDCNDQDSNAFPGQTKYFSEPTKIKGGFDYNCDKKEDKETDEYPGGSCRYCDAPERNLCLRSKTTCYYKNQNATLTCKLSKYSFLGEPRFTCDGQSPIQIRDTGYDKGFTTTVDCGKTGTYTDCGYCSTAGTAGTAKVDTAGYFQKCR